VDTLQAWARRAGRRPLDLSLGTPACLHTLNDDVIATLEPQLLPRDLVLGVRGITHTYSAQTPLYVKDIMTLRLIQENLGKRPIYFALTAGGGARMGLETFITQQGLAFKLWPDSVRPSPDRVRGLWNTPMEMDRTRRLAWETYRFARLFQVDSLELDPTNENIAGNMSFPYLGLGEGYRELGHVDSMLANYRRAFHLAPSTELGNWLRQFEQVQTNPVLLPDTARRDTARRDSAGRR
jgi:hypothetical protein